MGKEDLVVEDDQNTQEERNGGSQQPKSDNVYGLPSNAKSKQWFSYLRVDHSVYHLHTLPILKEAVGEACARQDKVDMHAIDMIANSLHLCAILISNNGNDSTFENVISNGIAVKTLYPHYFLKFDLLDLFTHWSIPLIWDRLRSWNPLVNPVLNEPAFFDALVLLKPFYSLQINAKEEGKVYSKEDLKAQISNMTFQETVLYNTILPKLQSAIVAWDMKDCSVLIEMLRVWTCLPDWMSEGIVYPSIIEKITNELKDGKIINLLTPKVWEAALGKLEFIESLKELQRKKFLYSLNHGELHPMAPSAVDISEYTLPWLLQKDQTIFMDILEVRISNCFMDMTLHKDTSMTESMGAFSKLMLWKDVITEKRLIEILLKHFFPKWFAMLENWIKDKPDYNLLCDWYLEWKYLIPQSIMGYDEIKLQLRKSWNKIRTLREPF